MKTKILSLCLALTVILSLFTIFPVSAEVADIVVLGGSFTSQGKTETVGTGQFYGKQVWATSNAGYLYADYTFEIAVSGYYNISIDAAGAYNNGGNPRTTLAIDGQQIHGNHPAVKIASTEILTTYIAKVYLEKGTRALRVCEESAHYNLENITFSYDETQTPETTLNLKPSAGSTTTTGRTFYYSNVPAEGSVSWATPHTVGLFQGSTASNCNLTIPFVSGEAAYYDVYFASGGTSDATMTATIGAEKVTGKLTATTSTTDVQETNIGRIYVEKGANTLTLGGSIGSSMKYIYNMKLVKSANQAPEPIDLEPTDGTKTSDGYVFSSTTAEPTTKDADWIDKGRVFIFGGSSRHGVSFSYTVKKAGYYDVLAGIGYPLENGQVYARFDGVGTLQCEAAVTTTGSDVKANNLGRIYLPEGTSTLDLRFGLIGGDSSTHLYLWDVRLQYSEDQTENESIIINAGHAKATSGDSEQNRFDWNVVTNTAGWASNSASKLSGPATYVDLDMYAVSSGYYEVYAAAGALNAAALISLRIGGEEVINAVKLTPGDSAAVAQETYLGKIYIQEGPVALRAESDANSGGYYLYDLKFTKATVEPIKLYAENGEAIEGDIIAGTKVYAEVKTSEDVRLFFASYQKEASGAIKLLECKEGVKDSSTGIFKTPALETKTGIVKAFVWEDISLSPLEYAQAKVVSE